MKRFVHFLQQYFSLSHHEAKGFASLLFVCTLSLMLYFLPSLIRPTGMQISKAESDRLDSLANALNRQIHGKRGIFSFNPNTVSIDSLELLGLAPRLAARLEHYRQAGGRFKVREDLLKIYGLPTTWYDSVYAYINLPEKASKIHESANLNTISAQQLQTTANIPTGIAQRICNYRDALGGYISFEQLAEVYHISKKDIGSVKKNTYLPENFVPRKIRINAADATTLKKHPYISNTLAEDIVRFREINGAIDSKMVLANFNSVDKRNFEKLIFYLDFH